MSSLISQQVSASKYFLTFQKAKISGLTRSKVKLFVNSRKEISPIQQGWYTELNHNLSDRITEVFGKLTYRKVGDEFGFLDVFLYTVKSKTLVNMKLLYLDDGSVFSYCGDNIEIGTSVLSAREVNMEFGLGRIVPICTL